MMKRQQLGREEPTPAEAYYDARYYSLDLNLNPATRILTGTVTMRATVVTGLSFRGALAEGKAPDRSRRVPADPLEGHGGAGRELRLLRQVGDRHAAPPLDLAGDGSGGPGEDAHQGRLARAVHAHQPHPLALVEREREAVEDGAAAVGEPQAGGVEERHRGDLARGRAHPRRFGRSAGTGC